MMLTAAGSTGFLVMEEETDSLNLWQPRESDYVKNIKWLRANFPSKTRVSSILILAPNVLEPVIVKSMFHLLQEVQGIQLNETQGPVWKKTCGRNPLTKKCLEFSLLEAFTTRSGEYETQRIEDLSTVQEVTQAIKNAQNRDALDPRGAFDPFRYLGSVEVGNGARHSIEVGKGGLEGDIFGAKAMLLNLVAFIDNNDDQHVIEDFERELVEAVNNFNFPAGTTAYPFTLRSVSDLIGGNVVSDLNTLAVGYVLIFIYVLVNLGKLNSIEQRAWLSVAGICAVVMGVATSFGLAAHMGVFYSKMNQILPFLMLGVGIDDMFVIVHAFDNLSTPEKQLKSLAQNMGTTMKHAGVAITITSVTDLLAFAIGATTVLPALSGFCIYASLGIFFIYSYAITFFLAWFSIDQRRAEDKRDGCICLKKEDWSPNECSQKSLLFNVFTWISEVLVSKTAKAIVILTTLVILGGGIYGAVKLDTYFDPNTFLDKGTYLRNYLELKEVHFPEDGYTG